jgi:hypothetical protein
MLEHCSNIALVLRSMFLSILAPRHIGATQYGLDNKGDFVCWYIKVDWDRETNTGRAIQTFVQRLFA